MIDKIRDSFPEGLTEYYKSGKMPDCVSLDMRYNLKAHSKRLESKGITYNVMFKDTNEGAPGDITKETGNFRSHMCWKRYNFIAAFTDIGKTTVKRDVANDDYLYCQIIERSGQRAEAEMPFTCPNCGHESTRDKFRDGCPMCGTAFLDHDLYPCVNSYHIIPRPLPTQKLFNKALMMAIFLAIFFGFMIGFVAAFAYGASSQNFLIGLGAFVVGWIAGATCTFVPTYLVINFVVAVKTTVGVIDMTANTHDIRVAERSKGDMERAMSAYDKDFSFEVFEGKVLSMLQTIAYSENRAECNMYVGKDDLSFLDDIIDIEYRGAMQFIKCTTIDGILHLVVKAYLDDVYYRAGEFKGVKENFILDIIRDEKAKTQVEFSPRAVNCPTCASTFDAVVKKHCPNCGTRYDLVSKEWTILKIQKEIPQQK